MVLTWNMQWIYIYLHRFLNIWSHGQLNAKFDQKVVNIVLQIIEWKNFNFKIGFFWILNIVWQIDFYFNLIFQTDVTTAMQM